MTNGDTRTNRVTARVIFEPTWMPVVGPDPRAGVMTLRRQGEDACRREEEIARTIEGEGYGILTLAEKLNSDFGAFRQDKRDPPHEKRRPSWKWAWYDSCIMIATALGAAEPEWDGKTGSWWINREKDPPLGWVKSAADVKRIAVPDWNDLPQVQEMLASRERWTQAFPDNPPGPMASYRLNVPGEKTLTFVGCPSFIDMGISLLGTTEFMTTLAGEPELADALMDKCFELSTSYGEFLQTMEDTIFEALIGFAGNCACMLSPSLYEKYSVAWDVRLFEHFKGTYSAPDDLPCNLHSCGPSAHLYPVWRRHPLQRNIATLQTRLLPEHVGELRRNLPDTYLQLTFHPQHFDVAHVEREEVRSALRKAALDVEYRDVRFVVFAIAHDIEDVAQLDTNLQAFYDELAEVNESRE